MATRAPDGANKVFAYCLTVLEGKEDNRDFARKFQILFGVNFFLQIVSSGDKEDT